MIWEDALVAALGSNPSVRRWRIGVAIAAVVLVGLGVWASLGLLAPAPCSAMDRYLEGVWDAESKASVHQGLLATQVAWAEAAARDVASVLEGYTGAWVAMRAEACAATRVHGEQSPALMDVRMRCLDRRLQGVAALADILAAADNGVAGHASRAVRQLGSLEDCADTEMLTRPAPLPDDNALRERIHLIEGEVARIEALGSAGRAEDALVQAQAAKELARATDYRPLEAEVTLLLGEAQVMTGDAETAATTIRKAILAAEAGNHDDLAARAWARLVHVTGVELAHYDAAHTWAEHAGAAAQRSGSTRRKGDLDCSLGRLLVSEGRYEQAAERFEICLAEREGRLGPDHLEIVGPLDGLASARRRQGRSTEAIRLYKRVLGIVEITLGSSHPDVAQVLGDLGRVLQERHRLREALGHHEQALSVLEAALGSEHDRVGTELVDLGQALTKLGRPAEAIVHLERALAINEATHAKSHPSVATTLFALGEAHEAAGRYQEALALMGRALTLRIATLGAGHLEVSTTRCAIGRVQTTTGAHAEALETLQSCLTALGEGSPRSAEGLIALAELRLATDSAAQAIEPLQRALDAWGARAETSLAARVRFALARVSWEACGDRDAAIDLAEDARFALSQAGDGFEDEVARIAAWLSERTEMSAP